MIALLSLGTAWADSCFTIGFNDTLWVNPNLSSYGKTVAVHANFEGRLDTWSITFTYPAGMAAVMMTPRSDMNIPYINSNGESAIHSASLTCDAISYASASSSIWQTGYWYNPNGVFESYGTVKWEAGFYDRMFDIQFMFSNDFFNNFENDSITIQSHMSSGPDARGGTIGYPVMKTKRTIVVLGNRPGDINGDDVVDTSDLTALISYTLGNTANWDQYQFAAGDLNGDGIIDVIDVTALIAMVLSDD